MTAKRTTVKAKPGSRAAKVHVSTARSTRPKKRAPVRPEPTAGRATKTARTGREHAARKAVREPAKPGAVADPGKDGRNLWQRQLRDRWVVYWRLAEKLPWAIIVSRDGRSERDLRHIVRSYEAAAAESDVFGAPLIADPVDLIEGALHRLVVIRDALMGAAMHAESPWLVVEALKTALATDGQYLDLLQAVGKLPKELGQLRHIVEVRELAACLDETLRAFEEERIDVGEVRKRVHSWAHIPPQLPAGDG